MKREEYLFIYLIFYSEYLSKYHQGKQYPLTHKERIISLKKKLTDWIRTHEITFVFCDYELFLNILYFSHSLHSGYIIFSSKYQL